MPKGYLSYQIVKNGQTSERKLLVIHGIPFYSSTGTSDDSEEIIAPAWRQELWMPFAGVKTEDKAGQICKLGEFYHREAWLENTIRTKLKTIYQSMDKEVADGHLYSLVYERFRVEPYTDTESNAYISPQMVRDGLAGQLARFGTLEAMIISMKVSPEIWAKNELIRLFMEDILKTYPAYSTYDSLNLPSYHVAILEKTITASKDDTDSKGRAALEINDWLLSQMVIPKSMVKSNVLIGVGLIAATTGSLILGNILNLGLLSGAGGAILAGLTTAAACTGFGLIALAGICLGIGIYIACKNSRSEKQEIKGYMSDNEVSRTHVRTFLLNNCSYDIQQKFMPTPKPSNQRFFTHAIDAIKRLCCPATIQEMKV